MINTEQLKEFRQTLEIITAQTDELISQRSKPRLFKNADDYYKQLKNMKYCVAGNYLVRIFDTQLDLNFNFRVNKYYIYIDTIHYEFMRRIEFSDMVSKYKLTQNSLSDKIYFIPQDYVFEDVVKIFSEISILILQLYISQDKLFYYKDL